MKNLIESAYTESERNSITAALSALEQLVAGTLPALSPEERRRWGAVNEQNKLLINKVRDYRANAPALSSPDVDWTEFESDHQMRSFFQTLSARLSSLAYQFESAGILHDHDNYQDALDDYSYTQYKAGASAPGAAEKVADLKQFFSRIAKTTSVAPGTCGCMNRFKTPIPVSGTPLTESRTPAEHHQTHALESRTHPMGSRTPKLRSQTPTTGFQTPTTGFQTPTEGLRTPSEGLRTPTDGFQTPTEGFQTTSAAYP